MTTAQEINWRNKEQLASNILNNIRGRTKNYGEMMEVIAIVINEFTLNYEKAKGKTDVTYDSEARRDLETICAHMWVNAGFPMFDAETSAKLQAGLDAQNNKEG